MTIPFASPRVEEWDEMRVVLQLVSGAYVTWRVRAPIEGRRVAAAAARVRELRATRAELVTELEAFGRVRA